MRYITASVGGLFIFVGVFILSALLLPMVPHYHRLNVQVGPMYTNNIVGVLLGMAAATASVRATLRREAKKRLRQQAGS
jgi:hypothetical protein